MIRLHFAVLSLFSLYFLSHLSGCPGFEQLQPPEPPGTESLFTKHQTVNRMGTQNSTASSGRSVDEPGPQKIMRLVRLPGLVERSLMQWRALNAFQDPLLVNEAKPDDLLRNLQRSLTADTFMSFLCTFWIIAYLASIAALYRRHWFYQPMLFFLMSLSLAVLFFLLLSQRRPELLTHYRMGILGADYLLLMRTYFEVFLFFSGLTLIFERMLPETKSARLDELRFMGHLRQGTNSLSLRLRNTTRTLFQLSLIITTGLALSNLILFPIYALQIEFPGFFAGLLAFGILALAWRYATAYLRVSRSQNAAGGSISGMSFLTFRILRNVIFVSSMVFLAVVAIGVITGAAFFNLYVLRSFSLLPEAVSL